MSGGRDGMRRKRDQGERGGQCNGSEIETRDGPKWERWVSGDDGKEPRLRVDEQMDQ